MKVSANIVGVAAALLLLPAHEPVNSRPPDRAGFYAALSKLVDKMPASEVRRLLGPPDDIVRNSPHSALWNYGTDKPGGIPTLGQVPMTSDRLDMPVTWEDPDLPHFKQRMPEAELRKVLREVAGEDRGKYDETAWLVRTANVLIDLGAEKTKFVFDEYRRQLLYAQVPDNQWQIDCLMRLVFEVPNPPGYPREQQEGDMTPLKAHFRNAGRFPMIVFRDIPFEISYGFMMAGPPYLELADYHKYPIRTKHLHPPDDPFLACEQLIASDQWPFPAHNKSDERFAIRFKEMEGDAMKQVLSLAFSAYKPVDYRSYESFNGLDLGKFRAGFLKVHARWDDKLSRYVRPDGLVLKEKPDRPNVAWSPFTAPNLSIKVSLQRKGDTDDVDAKVETNCQKSGIFRPSFIRLINAKTGALIDRIGCGRDFPALGTSTKPKPGDERSALSGPTLAVASLSVGHGLTLPLGDGVRVEWVTRDRVVRGPVLKP